MAASCINVSVGAASLLAGRFASVQAVGSSQNARHGAGAACGSVSCSSSVERKFVFGFGFETSSSRAARNGCIVARAVELDENKDGIVVVSDDESATADAAVAEEPPAPAATAPNSKLYVGNLPWKVDSKQLAEVFQEETLRSRGFAFVTMRTTEDAERAIEKLDGSELGGRVLKVNFPQSPKEPRTFRNERPPPRERREGEGYGSRSVRNDSPNKIFIGNLAWSVDDVALKQLASEYGQVAEAKVIHDKDTGRSKGFAYVTMSTGEEVETAIQALDGAEYDGRILRVNRASDRPERKAGSA
ncbi:hypothetical protein R1sor_011039 [Riccia sorocarpa]|uniref:RRM domain-containing protein n=1 Tax=Riccia sorocarpa TaxID=122646 RepID=A0ABD3HZS9_9MARC